VVWDDLARPRRTGTRAWLDLADGELTPSVLEVERPSRLVWSSLWSDLVDDRLELTLTPHGSETHLAVVMVGFGEAPARERAAAVRYRLGEVFYRDLRRSYDQ
jgi:uncharacterized protein YndB with AHSA1/START domain